MGSSSQKAVNDLVSSLMSPSDSGSNGSPNDLQYSPPDPVNIFIIYWTIGVSLLDLIIFGKTIWFKCNSLLTTPMTAF